MILFIISAIFNVTVKRGMVRVFGNEAHRNFHLAIDNGRLLGQVSKLSHEAQKFCNIKHQFFQVTKSY